MKNQVKKLEQVLNTLRLTNTVIDLIPSLESTDTGKLLINYRIMEKALKTIYEANFSSLDIIEELIYQEVNREVDGDNVIS